MGRGIEWGLLFDKVFSTMYTAVDIRLHPLSRSRLIMGPRDHVAGEKEDGPATMQEIAVFPRGSTLPSKMPYGPAADIKEIRIDIASHKNGKATL